MINGDGKMNEDIWNGANKANGVHCRKINTFIRKKELSTKEKNVSLQNDIRTYLQFYTRLDRGQ